MQIHEINDLPDILSLNSKELIEWCNSRKKASHISNAKLANMTGVPEGTIDRILTGKNLEFRYSTIQPIIRLLIGYNEDIPKDKSSDYYADTIEGYKLVIENKNHIISEQQRILERLEAEKEHLRKADNEKLKCIDKLQEHISWLEKLIDKRGCPKT